jgi:hypothetical protein
MAQGTEANVTIDDLAFICGLMRENYEAVGFLPNTVIRQRYISLGRYVLQTDERGRKIGYLLHGKPTPGGLLTVAQHAIDYDRRLNGHGQAAFETLLDRAKHANCRAIRVRCAADLPANSFWQSMGLDLVGIQHVANKRKRAINILWLDLWPTLFCPDGGAWYNGLPDHVVTGAR